MEIDVSSAKIHSSEEIEMIAGDAEFTDLGCLSIALLDDRVVLDTPEGCMSIAIKKK